MVDRKFLVLHNKIKDYSKSNELVHNASLFNKSFITWEYIWHSLSTSFHQFLRTARFWAARTLSSRRFFSLSTLIRKLILSIWSSQNFSVVDQMRFCSKSDLGHSQIRISISNFPNQNWNIHVRNVTISQIQLGIS